MCNAISRRSFIRTAAIGGAGILSAPYLSQAFDFSAASAPLNVIAHQLINEWGKTLLAMQITDKQRVDDDGGIWCPADKAVHGRVGDAIYPFFYLAAQTKDSRYTDAAILLYRWIERRVSQPDGSWLNEPVKGSWKGTTVFMSIALGETLKHYSHLMTPDFKAELTTRLHKAGDFIHSTFNINFGNINYPINGAYAMALLGEVLNEPKFSVKGRELAHQAMAFITPKSSLLEGEGDHYHEPTQKGCYSVDLGYNVEESLPALTQYGLLTNDEAVLSTVTRALQSHMEFMLPDGAWDNSWGTRSYKWTYWGSRTSDGCQTAYALLMDRDPRFYTVALRNTQLMVKTTVNGLLQGGPDFAAHGVPVCVHHTFTHIKALVNIVDFLNQKAVKNPKIISLIKPLPREQAYGLKLIADVQTWLVAKGNFRATVTGYDRDYKHTPNGHATGGALTMLWHPHTGPILCASMNQYQMVEAGNQQIDNDPHSMPLTPRIETRDKGNPFMNISDHEAEITTNQTAGLVHISTRSRLVDKDQKDPATGAVHCQVDYYFMDGKVMLKYRFDKGNYAGQVRFILPVIAKSKDKAVFTSSKTLSIKKQNGHVIKVASSQPLVQLPATNGRIFNFVPGLEALPLAVDASEGMIEIMVV